MKGNLNSGMLSNPRGKWEAENTQNIPREWIAENQERLDKLLASI